jgi:hypothetical protein
MAGLGGSAVAGLATAFIFKGLIGRIIAQLVVTTVLSFFGFIALLSVLGFQIIPPQQVAGIPVPGSSDTFAPASVPGQQQAPAPSGYTIKSPWR